MKTLSTTNSINRLPLRYGLFLIALALAFWAVPGTAHGQMFASVNAQPFTNGSGLIYQYDPTGTYTTFLDNLAPHPRGLAFDSAGNLYVATFTWLLDSDGNILDVDQASILKISGGVTSTFATVFGGTATAVATDSADPPNVFFSSQLVNNTSSTIYKVTPDGTVSTFGSVPGQCFGLAFNSAGNLFASGSDSTLTYGTIYEFTSSGGEPSIFVGSEPFSSEGPVGLVFDASDPQILFASTITPGATQGGIRKFGPGGAESTLATGLTNNPRGLAFDSASNLFVAEPGVGATPGDILKFTPDGTQTVFATAGFGTRGNRGPEYLAFAPVAVTQPTTAVTLTFPDATETVATTVVTSVDQNSVPLPPSNFELSGNVNLAFEITTVSEPTPPIIIGFTVPSSLDVSTLKALHYENGNWVDSTIYPGDPNYPSNPAPNTVYASVNSLSPFLVARFRYAAQIQQPINANGTSVFNVRRGVIPVKFTLTDNGSSTCTLPPATIAVTRMAGGMTGAINESVYSGSADNGSNFRIVSCQYVYNLNSNALGVGTYRVDAKVNGTVVGSATFELK